MDIKFQFPDEQDIQDLLANISEEDRLEILALGVDPEWGIRHSISPDVNVLKVLFCLFGWYANSSSSVLPRFCWLGWITSHSW